MSGKWSCPNCRKIVKENKRLRAELELRGEALADAREGIRLNSEDISRLYAELEAAQEQLQRAGQQVINDDKRLAQLRAALATLWQGYKEVCEDNYGDFHPDDHLPYEAAAEILDVLDFTDD